MYQTYPSYAYDPIAQIFWHKIFVIVCNVKKNRLG